MPNWAFDSQRLMFPLRAQVEQAGNQAMMQGVHRGVAGIQQNQVNAQQAMHEMSAMHLKQQAFDQQVLRQAQIQDASNRSLDLRSKDMLLKSQALQHARDQKMFEREFAEKESRRKFGGRKIDDKENGYYTYINEAGKRSSEFQTKEERDEEYDNEYPAPARENRKLDAGADRVAIAERRADTYQRRAEDAERKNQWGRDRAPVEDEKDWAKIDETQRSHRANEDLGSRKADISGYRAETGRMRVDEILKHNEWGRKFAEDELGLKHLVFNEKMRNNMSREQISKEANRLRGIYLEKGGTAGEWDRMYRMQQSRKMQVDSESRIGDDYRKDMEALRAIYEDAGGINAKWTSARRARDAGAEKGDFVFSQEERDSYKRQAEEIENTRKRRIRGSNPDKKGPPEIDLGWWGKK